MAPRYIVALGRAYLIGWAVIIAALVYSPSRAPSFVFFSFNYEKDFIMFVAVVWACYTIPGLIIALVLWIGSSPSLRAWLVLQAQSGGQKTEPGPPLRRSS
jgi:hypothetical protein